MSVLGLASLLIQETKAQIYDKALVLAESLGVPTTSWEPGDPTRSTYHLVSEILSELEGVVARFVASGFLDHAEGEWLTLLAKQVYNVDRIPATYATTAATLTNGGGGIYPIAAGELTFRNTATGKTYRNTNPSVETLASGPGTTLTVDVVADEAGTASNAIATEIDALVTGLLGVTVSNAAAATATDEESDASLRDRCRNKLASLSPNGPRGAYEYVATTPDLAGTSEVTRVRTIPDSDTGDLVMYVAGSSGAITTEALALVEAAILRYATPLTITPTVNNATNITIDVTYQLWLYEAAGVTTDEAETAVAAALAALMLARPIGGDVIGSDTGRIYQSLIESTIRETYPGQAFHVVVSAPAADTDLTIGQVGVLGTVTPTITFEVDP